MTPRNVGEKKTISYEVPKKKLTTKASVDTSKFKPDFISTPVKDYYCA